MTVLKHRKSLVTITAISLALIAGVAIAMFILNAKVTGNVDTRSASYQWMTQGTAYPSTSGTAAVCTATVPSALAENALSINVSGYPGDTCTVSAMVKTVGASEGFRVTGVALTGLPVGWTAALSPSFCGKTAIPDVASAGEFTITVGSSGSGPIAGGLSLSPVSQVGTGAITCP